MSTPHLDTSILHKATISYEYLHTNSTTHEFLFGAIAELVDNSRDAKANNLHIDFVESQQYGGMLSVLDDGCGLDRSEAISVVSFGHSLKRMVPGMVGQYGNGLKSGAMRIAKDFILFTKKDGLLTCLLLSRTFHEKYALKEVFVPAPSFTIDGGHRAMYCDSQQTLAKHGKEMEIIYDHTPFNSQDKLFEQFSRISGPSGTLIVLFHLRRIETGDFELDFKTDTFDMKLSNFEEQREEERNSLRAYLSVLYINPRMKVYLRGKKVLTNRILSNLLYPYKYNYAAKNLKACAAKELEKCEKKVHEVNDLLALARSSRGEFEAKYRGVNIVIDKSLRTEQRMLQRTVQDLEQKLEQAKDRVNQAQKAKKNPPPLTFFFGLNIHHRNRYGCMIYNNGRLIELYVKTAVQKEKNDLMMKCLGVVGVVDVPYSVLEPTHNKQSFENKREYLSLLKSMNDHMEQYWGDIGIGSTPGGIKGFWKPFGYDNSQWSSVCTNGILERQTRFVKTGHTVQCNQCLKWRHLPFQRRYMENGIPDDWCCKNHPNSLLQNCTKKEEQPKVKEGRLIREKSPEVQVLSRQGNASSSQLHRDVKSEFQDSSFKAINGGRKPTIVTYEREQSPLIKRNREAREAGRRRLSPTYNPPPRSQPSRSAARRLRTNSIQEESPEPIKKSQKIVELQSERAIGRPPMKRAATTRKVLSESEDEVEEPILIEKKPKTKADLRRRLEEEAKKTMITSMLSTFPTAKDLSSSSEAVISSTAEEPSITSTNGSGMDHQLIERAERGDRALLQIKRLINFFIRQGCTFAEKLKKGGDDAILEVDMDQFGRNLWEEKVLKPLREKDEARLRDKIEQRRIADQELKKEILAIMKWANSSINGEEHISVTEENCFTKMRTLVNMLEPGIQEGNSES